MGTLTNYERVTRVLDRKPVDQLPYCEDIWGDTRARYVTEGKVGEDEDLATHFGFCLRSGGWLNGVADLDFEAETLEEDEETVLTKNGNGATLRQHKQHASTPEHVDFEVKDRAKWEELIKPHLLDVNRRRIPFDSYRASRQKAADEGQYFTWSGVAPFEQMHPVCGHEHMCMGMALDPDWIADMVLTYAQFTINHMEVLFAEEGVPDGVFFYEDMGFKQRPFMSPAMYKALIQPGHKLLFDYAHSLGRKVIVHSCGFVEPLLPGLVEAGMDCLQAMEVKAGMDMPRIAETFGDQIAFFGNIDVRKLIENDRAAIKEELETKVIPVMAQGGGFIVHSDHSIPPEVDYETLVYFFEEGAKLASHYKHAR